MQICDVAVRVAGRAHGVLRAGIWLVILALAAGLPGPLAAQQVLTQASRTVTIARGASALVQTATTVQRLSIADPAIADVQAISPREVLVNAQSVGTTTLLIWDNNERVSIYAIVVTPDIGALQRQMQTLFPNAAVQLSASGNAIIVSGNVRDPHVARRIVQIIESSGATVLDNMIAPAPRQVLLHVRFAEVNRSVLSRFNSDLAVTNPQNLGEAFDDPALVGIETLSEGVVRLLLLGDNGSSFESLIRALKTQGNFKSLAEPNLIAIEGQTATFLAGGEFPYPTVQGGGAAGGGTSVAVTWKEFGVRLAFTPVVTNIGTIRLQVTPEVSSLDFANGVTIGGFQLPSLLTRRVDTSVDLRPGQHLAIAGLLDNTTLIEGSKIPLLGDLPIIGTFFRTKSTRDRNTELLVIVTPHIVEPTDTPPALPTGETDTWDRTKYMKERTLELPAGVRIVPPRPPADN
jgi:pilus assembly protein CpaC